MLKRNKSPEDIALNLLLYSFIIGMVVFAVFRFCGIAWFSQNYISVECTAAVYYIVASVLHITEGFIILSTLTNLRWHNCLLLSICYDVLLYIIVAPQVQFILDILFTVSVPFIFNKDKDKSILNSCMLFIGITVYQIIMMFSRYSMAFTGKYDIAYALLSIIDYRCFLVVILLLSKKFKRRA